MMNKVIGIAVWLLCASSCAQEDEADYYPVGNVDIERGGPAYVPAPGEEPLAECRNEEDYVLDTVAQYPSDPTLGKLTFMMDLKNQTGEEVSEFNGIGKSGLTMSLGYTNGNYAAESQVPIYDSQDVTARYAVCLRLKGELSLAGDEWMIDFVYVQLAGLFQPYPPADFPEVFMCKGGELQSPLASFDSFRRTWTFDIEYNRSNLSFSQLYYNMFVNLAGQKREERVRLRIDKDSYFKIYKQKE